MTIMKVGNGSIFLFLTVLMGFAMETKAQVLCVTPKLIGELRVLKSKKCIDVEGSTGSGNVITYRCDGLNDQQIIICEDGTIRDQESNSCFSAGESGDGDVTSTVCQVYPEIPDYQKWRLGRTKTFTDNGGIEQEAREIINVKSEKCLDVKGSDGDGNLLTYDCQNMDDQLFYIRSRGELVAHGRLQVQKSGLCVDVKGSDASRESNILIYACENAPDQWFRFYENGELVNDKSRLCVDVPGSEGEEDSVALYECEDATDQMWSKPNQYCDGEYCSFVNKKSGLCLDSEGSEAESEADMFAYQCQTAPDQRFKWVTENWVTPTVSWTMVGCNQNGPVSHEITNSVETATAITASVSLEVSATIEAGCEFASTSLTTTISTSLSSEWSESHSKEKKVTFECKTYDSGEEFTRGCMWQLLLETEEQVGDNNLKWKPLIVKCTKNEVAPTCPPFTKCKDEECTMCEEMPGKLIRKKKVRKVKKHMKIKKQKKIKKHMKNKKHMKEH